MKRLIVALCALVSVAACSDDSSSADPPSPSPTVASSTAEPSPTQEPETPEEFVRRWVAADTRMQNDGNTKGYREMSRRCPNCQRYADRIDEIYAMGGYVKTNGWTIRRARTAGPTDQGVYEVTIRVSSAPTRYVEKKGGPILSLPGGDRRYLISVTRAGSSFTTIDFAQVAA